MRALFLDVYLLLLNTRRGRVGKGRLWPLFTADGLGEGKEYVFCRQRQRESAIWLADICVNGKDGVCGV